MAVVKMEVVLKATIESEEIAAGKYPPQRIRSEITESLIVVIDAADRLVGNGCNFTVDLKSEVTRVRLCRVARLILPKLPTINAKNDTFVIKHEDGTVSGTLDKGFYNINTLLNEITTKFNIALASVGDSVTTAYDSRTRVISITSVNGKDWFFTDSCSFIRYGLNVHGFQGKDAALDPTIDGAITHFSDTCGLIYSRYITLKSRNLQAYVRNSSINSKGQTDILATACITDNYSAADFDPSSVYTGSFIVDRVIDDSPVFLIAGPRFSALRQIDIKLEDEFGFPIEEIINISPSGVNSFNALVYLIFSL